MLDYFRLDITKQASRMSNFLQYLCGNRTQKFNTANNKTLDGKDSYPFPSTNYHFYLLKLYLNTWAIQ
jgi:hypothetical protein